MVGVSRLHTTSSSRAPFSQNEGMWSPPPPERPSSGRRSASKSGSPLWPSSPPARLDGSSPARSPSAVRFGAVAEPKRRTSETHPITISWVLSAADGGECTNGVRLGHHAAPLGLCYCPGKRRVFRDGVVHDRDLKADLCRLRDDFGVRVVVTLLSEYEMRSLGVKNYEQAVRDAGLELLRFEIVEMAAPESVESVRALLCSEDGILSRLSVGKPVAVHCRGGVGRAGTIVACAYLELGICSSAAAAISLVRERRCKTAVESSRQERFIAAYAKEKRARRQQQ